MRRPIAFLTWVLVLACGPEDPTTPEAPEALGNPTGPELAATASLQPSVAARAVAELRTGKLDVTSEIADLDSRILPALEQEGTSTVLREQLAALRERAIVGDRRGALAALKAARAALGVDVATADLDAARLTLDAIQRALEDRGQ